MNAIFLTIVMASFAITGYRQITWSAQLGGAEAPMQALTSGMIAAAKDSVTLALGLIGVMALFLGLMKVAEAGGLLRVIARLVRPLMVRLFPEVPAEHPAMGAMIMNISANALGLGNAATPFGIRAMQELAPRGPVPAPARPVARRQGRVGRGAPDRPGPLGSRRRLGARLPAPRGRGPVERGLLWYAQAGRPRAQGPLAEEWAHIAQALLENAGPSGWKIRRQPT